MQFRRDFKRDKRSVQRLIHYPLRLDSDGRIVVDSNGIDRVSYSQSSIRGTRGLGKAGGDSDAHEIRPTALTVDVPQAASKVRPSGGVYTHCESGRLLGEALPVL